MQINKINTKIIVYMLVCEEISILKTSITLFLFYLNKNWLYVEPVKYVPVDKK